MAAAVAAPAAVAAAPVAGASLGGMTYMHAQGDLPTGNTMASRLAAGDYRLVATLATTMLQAFANANRAGRSTHVFMGVKLSCGQVVGACVLVMAASQALGDDDAPTDLALALEQAHVEAANPAALATAARVVWRRCRNPRWRSRTACPAAWPPRPPARTRLS